MTTADTTRDQLIRKAQDAIRARLTWPSMHWGVEDVDPDAWRHIAAAAVDAVLDSDLIPKGVTTEQWGVRFTKDDPKYVPGVVLDWLRDRPTAEAMVKRSPSTRYLLHRVTTSYPPRHHTTEVDDT